MAQSRHDLGIVGMLKAEALGEPGNRRFRLLVKGPGGDACLWLEKEQLLQLALVLRQITATESPGEPPEEPIIQGPGLSEPRPTSMEFNVMKLTVGHEPGRDLFLVQAHDMEGDPEGDALLGFWASRPQVEGLVKEALAVCAAGRPRCPLCGGPMGQEPHICPKANGHSTL